MVDIKMDYVRAEAFVRGCELWPVTGREGEAGVRSWWFDVLKSVLWAVNETDWNDEVYPEDKYTEIAETAVAQHVAQARKNKRVMTILELSEVHKVVTEPFDGGVYMRLTSTVVELSHQGLFGHPEDDGADARRARKEEVAKLLTLDSVTEAYLSAAADDVARAWVEALVQDWREANPEDDDDEDEEE